MGDGDNGDGFGKLAQVGYYVSLRCFIQRCAGLVKEQEFGLA